MSPKQVRNLYNDYIDVMEHIATYGLEGLTEQELIYARKLVDASQEFLETMENEEATLLEEKEEE